MSKAIKDVIAERQRQIKSEGWTPEHDDQHKNGELPRAAGLYAISAGFASKYLEGETKTCPVPDGWPWNHGSWKPTNSRRDLVKAAALILAEIERLDRQTGYDAAEFFDLIAHLHRQREFSERTFGPGARAAGVIDHIRKELNEIEAKPDDVSEWVDVILLALDGAWRAGFSPEQIAKAIDAKQTKNEGRIWPDWRTAEPGKAIEHDRSQEATAPAIVFFPCGSLGESVDSEGGDE
jgi:hypothetical protein